MRAAIGLRPRAHARWRSHCASLSLSRGLRACTFSPFSVLAEDSACGRAILQAPAVLPIVHLLARHEREPRECAELLGLLTALAARAEAEGSTELAIAPRLVESGSMGLLLRAALRGDGATSNGALRELVVGLVQVVARDASVSARLKLFFPPSIMRALELLSASDFLKLLGKDHFVAPLIWNGACRAELTAALEARLVVAAESDPHERTLVTEAVAYAALRRYTWLPAGGYLELMHETLVDVYGRPALGAGEAVIVAPLDAGVAGAAERCDEVTAQIRYPAQVFAYLLAELDALFATHALERSAETKAELDLVVETVVCLLRHERSGGARERLAAALTVTGGEVSFLLFTVTLHANHAHNLTRSP